MSTNIDSTRWEEVDNDKWGAHWLSKEDKRVTVNVNLEELEPFNDEDEAEQSYLVYPALNEIGIPSSPDVYRTSGYLNLEDARDSAIETAKKIMKLRIDRIISFDWAMIE